MNYCQGLITRPTDTVLVLVSDLFEGGDREKMLKRVAAIVNSGVKMIALLALSDQGAPSFDHTIAASFSAMGIPSFACTPDAFPDLMAAAMKGDDLQAFAAKLQA